MLQPIIQPKRHYLGMVVNRKGGRLLADLKTPGKPTVNDMATLLANAMWRPLDEHARRPRTIQLKANQRWLELFQSLEGLWIAVDPEKKLPKIGNIVPELLAEHRAIQRVKMIRPEREQIKVEGLFPSIVQYVRRYGFIEVRLVSRKGLGSSPERSSMAVSTSRTTRPRR